MQIADGTDRSPTEKPRLSLPVFRHIFDCFATGAARSTGRPQVTQASSLGELHPPWMQCCRNLADAESGKKFRKTVTLTTLPDILRIDFILCIDAMLPIFNRRQAEISSVKSGGKWQCSPSASHFYRKKRQKRHRANAA